METVTKKITRPRKDSKELLEDWLKDAVKVLEKRIAECVANEDFDSAAPCADMKKRILKGDLNITLAGFAKTIEGGTE